MKAAGWRRSAGELRVEEVEVSHRATGCRVEGVEKMEVSHRAAGWRKWRSAIELQVGGGQL